MEPKENSVRIIPTALINVNPNNPRMIFDQEKMDELVSSIKERGVLVPLTVHQQNKKFVIIDGERRYKAALQLGLSKLPANIMESPDPDEYVVDMFHIHEMREKWELVPTAWELERAINYLRKKKKREPTEKELHEVTKLTISEVRRCKTVLAMPKEIQELMLQSEAKTTKEKNAIGKDKLLTEDFFIEITKNIIEPLENNNKKAFGELGGKLGLYRSLTEKRRQGYVKNIVALRPVSKYIKQNPIKASTQIRKYIQQKNYSTEQLIDEANLSFNIFNFRRNSNIFIGAIENIPAGIDDKDTKLEVKKILRNIRAKIKQKLNELT